MTNWKDFWEKKASSLSKEVQVGRVVNGTLMTEDLKQKIAHRIVEQLMLQNSDALLDVCCGNGLLSSQLTPFCRQVHGVDFSESLIEQAKLINDNKLNFSLGNAENFKLNQHFDKALLYFSFQYFEKEKMAQEVLQNILQHVNKGGTILIGDIPDKRKLFQFYNSPLRLLRWVKQNLTQSNDMGRFWHPKELINICNKLGAVAMVQEQEKWQPYSHYRFDLIIRKPQ
jgi:2-polyprenyl-3-methyl-5-hydroxy-6-metoxy-1,4-benzoquinol methylase